MVSFLMKQNRVAFNSQENLFCFWCQALGSNSRRNLCQRGSSYDTKNMVNEGSFQSSSLNIKG